MLRCDEALKLRQEATGGSIRLPSHQSNAFFLCISFFDAEMDVLRKRMRSVFGGRGHEHPAGALAERRPDAADPADLEAARNDTYPDHAEAHESAAGDGDHDAAHRAEGPAYNDGAAAPAGAAAGVAARPYYDERRLRPPQFAPSRRRPDSDRRPLVDRLGADGDILAEELDAVLPQSSEEDAAAEKAANDIEAPDVQVNWQSLAAEAAAPLAGGDEGGQGGGPEAAAAQPLPVPPGPPPAGRIDVLVDDGYTLFGDSPREVQDFAQDRALELSLQWWALTFLIPTVAVTALLALLHGLFGQRLGVFSNLLRRGGALPRTARALFQHASAVLDAMGFSRLLVSGQVELPNDPALRAWGGRHYVEYFYAPDLRKCIAALLMNPKLTTGFYYDPHVGLDARWVCGDVHLSAVSRARRLERVERARETLAEDIRDQIPGARASDVGIIGVGLHGFVDGTSPHKWNLATNVTAFLASPSNLRADVINSPDSVALVGLWNSCKVLRAAKSKAATEDNALNASPATIAAAARVDAELLEHVVAVPLRDALSGGGPDRSSVFPPWAPSRLSV